MTSSRDNMSRIYKQMVDKYDLYGNIFHITCHDQKMLDVIRTIWEPFYRKTCESNPKAIFHIDGSGDVSSCRKKEYFWNRDLVFYRDSRQFLTCDFRESPWQIYLHHAYDINYRSIAFGLLDPALRNALKRLGIFRLHSAAVSKNGSGILIPGCGGCGKTTMTLRLIREGFEYLSDDGIFLQRQGSIAHALRFERDLFLTCETLSFFPELSFLRKTRSVKKGNRFKKRLTATQVKNLYSTPIVEKTKVDAVVFPKIVGNRNTKLERIPEPDAFVRMLEHESRQFNVMKDPVAMQNQMDFYAALNASAKMYDLLIGKEAESIPKIISDILK